VEGFHDFVIRRGGLDVFPQLMADGKPASPVGGVASGVAELDRLVGGGLTWGTTTLVIGPAGTGKSTLCAQYLASSGPDARSAIFLFDERAGTFLSRCDALGMELSSKIADGSILLEEIEPGRLSPGEFSQRVRNVVEKNKARIVLLDSLNGYLNAIPQ